MQLTWVASAQSCCGFRTSAPVVVTVTLQTSFSLSLVSPSLSHNGGLDDRPLLSRHDWPDQAEAEAEATVEDEDEDCPRGRQDRSYVCR